MTPRPETGPSDTTIRKLSSRNVYENPWMRLWEDVIERPDGSQGIYSYVDKPDFALVIPVEQDGFHLIEQYRYPVSHRSWEFPKELCPTGKTQTQLTSPEENSPKRPVSAQDTSVASVTFIPPRA